MSENEKVMAPNPQKEPNEDNSASDKIANGVVIPVEKLPVYVEKSEVTLEPTQITNGKEGVPAVADSSAGATEQAGASKPPGEDKSASESIANGTAILAEKTQAAEETSDSILEGSAVTDDETVAPIIADSSVDALEEIGKRISDFLDASINSGNPVFHSAKQIMSDLLCLMPSEEPTFSIAKTLVVKDPAVRLQPEPKKWPEALRLVSLCFQRADTDALHPMSDKSVQSQNRDGRPIYCVKIDLINPLILQLLKKASNEDLIKLVQTVTDLRVLSAITQCMPQLKIQADTFATIIHYVDNVTRSDMIRGNVMEPLKLWVQAYPDKAKEVVDNWLVKCGAARDLGHTSIFFIVRSLTLKADAALMDWRNKVIDTLNRSNDGDSWSLAVQLACFAWPEGTSPEIRHREMISYVGRLPERLVEPALRALSFDAREASEASVKTGLLLLGLLNNKADSRVPANPALLFAEAMQSVAWARNGMPALPRVLLEETLAALLQVPLGRDHSPLDAFLAELIKTEPLLAREFLAQWILHHGQELVQRDDALNEVFPLLPAEVLNQWLISFIAHQEPRLRNIAVRLWNKETELSSEMLDDLDSVKLQGVMNQLAGNMSSAQYVPLIVRLGELRPESLPTAVEILAVDAVGNCPQTCSKSIDLYWKESGVNTVQEAYKHIQSKLDERKPRWEKRLAIPELRTSWNSDSLFAELFNRKMQKSMKDYRESGKAIFAQIATTVNIIYGSKSVGPYNQEIEFSKYESKLYEQPILEIIDKLGELRKRRQYLEKAAQLLSEKEEAK